MPAPSIEFYNQAIDSIQSGRLPEALASVENSLTENPADTESWQLYAVVLNALGRTADAEKATAKLKTMGLSETDECLIKASAAMASGDVKDAIALYEAAIASDPSRPEIHASLALALMEGQYTADALAAAELAVSLAPDDAHSNYTLGHILRLTQKNEGALAALTKAVSADPGLLIALYEQGMVLADAGRYSEALSNFKKVLQAQPGDESASQAVAVILAKLENK